MARKPYPTDVSDDEWAFVAPYLALLPEAAASDESPAAMEGALAALTAWAQARPG